MGLSLDPSLFSLAAQQSLLTTSSAMQSTIQQLSTGLRINSAADDPAGLAIGQSLNSQISGYAQGAQNSQSAINLAQTAEGGMSQVSSILQRMNTLSVQAANGTNTQSDLSAIQTEMNQLASSLTTITNSTTFQGINLMSGAFQNQTFQSGSGGNSSNVSLSIPALDAASLGVAGNAANLSSTQNSAIVQSLTNIGSGFLGTNVGETYQISSTALSGGPTGAIFNSVTNAANTAAVGQNKGSETLGFTGNATASGNYDVKVTTVSSSGQITGMESSTNGGSTWTTAAVSNNSFALNGTTGTFTNGAATAQVGDQFTFAASAGAPIASVTNSTNVGNATIAFSGSYTGTSNQQIVVRASGLDGFNNVNQIQMSTDGGNTFTNTINTTTSTTGSGQATAFTLGNGLNVTWNQSTINAGQIALNNDSYAFNVVAANQNTQILQLSDTTQVAGVAKFTGATANIGQSVLLNSGQIYATVGTGNQAITANFNAMGTTNGITAGNTAFTVSTPQAAITSNGQVLQNASTPAGLNVMTIAGANAATATINNAMSKIAAAQATAGAFVNTMQTAMQYDSTAQTNLSQSYSNIMDVNVAQASVQLAQQRILQQSSVAILAQINQQMPSLAMKLLG